MGCFWTWQKGVLLVCFFQALMLLWFVFCVSGKVARMLKMLCFFFHFLGFCGVVYSCLFGFGRFRCFCGSCVCFLLFRFWFCLFWLCFGFVVGLLLELLLFFYFFVFVFLFCFFCICFFGGSGEVAQRATSLGPKPSLCFLFCFFVGLFLFCCLFLFGGFKGQVRWPKGPPHLA